MNSIEFMAKTPAANPVAPLIPLRPIASAIHTLSLLAMMAGWAYLGQMRATGMRVRAAPNHPLSYLITMAFEWIMFAYVVYGIHKRGITLREIVGPRWKSVGSLFLDLGIAVGFLITSFIILAIVAHLIHAPSSMDRIRFMIPQGPVEIGMWVALSLTAGICEETIFRGYLQGQFMAWTRNASAGIVLSAALFGAAHIYQGGKQTIVIAAFGLLFGILAALRRSLKPGMIAHFAQDCTAGIVVGYLIKNKVPGF
jgi:membrane protease YdiL (CAAX protease family)